MRNHIRLGAVAIALILFPLGASHADWDEDTLAPGKAASYTFTDTTAPSVIRTRLCATVKVWLVKPDSAKVFFWHCDDLTCADGDRTQIRNYVDGVVSELPFDGTTELSGNQAVRANFIGMTVDTAPTTSATARVECYQ